MTTKYIIYDHEKKEWFRPTYPGQRSTITKEILFSQSGEMYFHEHDLKKPEDCHILVHLNHPDKDGNSVKRYEAFPYTHVKDKDDKKIYLGHKVKFFGDIVGTVIMRDGCYCLKVDSDIKTHVLAWMKSGDDDIEIVGHEVEERLTTETETK